MKIKTQLLLILILFTTLAHGHSIDTTRQKELYVKRTLNLLTGISFGQHAFAEVGLSKNRNTVVGVHPFSSAYFVSTEINLGNKFILAPKVGAWASGGAGAMVLGLNMMYYTDFKNGSLALRPEIGFGFGKVKLVYGYNAILNKYKLEGINRSLGSIVYCFTLTQQKSK